MLACGLAAILVLPLLVRRYVGGPTCLALAWLLAISPLHIYFSRYARPYSITLLLAIVGAIAFFNWWSGGQHRWSVLYVVAASTAPYFHLTVLPIVLAPLLFAAGECFVRSEGKARRSFADLLHIGAGVTGALAVLLAVPVVMDLESVARKAGRSDIKRATLKGLAQLLSGTGQMWLVALVGALVLAGGIVLVRRHTRLAAYLACLTACQLSAMVIASPFAIEAPIVLARYAFSLLAIILLCAAAGVIVLQSLIQDALPAWPGGGVATVVVGLLLSFGPLPRIYYYPNDWTNHAVFQHEYDQTSPYAVSRYLQPGRMSPFYQRLATLPPATLLVIEAPWYYEWINNPYPYYQAAHHQHMHVGFVADPNRFVRPAELPLGRALRLHNAVHVGDLKKLRKRRVKYVIFHKRFSEEVPNRLPRDVVDVSSWVERYSTAFGGPVYEDLDIAVFDVTSRKPG
jgi:hypothetical protein